MRVLSVLLIATLVPGCSQSAPKVVPESFAQQFEKEVDRANAQLKVYTNTQCDDKNFKKVQEQTQSEYQIFKSMVKNIPENEDSMTQVKQIEEFLGFQYLLADIVNDKQQCIETLPKGLNHEASGVS